MVVAFLFLMPDTGADVMRRGMGLRPFVVGSGRLIYVQCMYIFFFGSFKVHGKCMSRNVLHVPTSLVICTNPLEVRPAHLVINVTWCHCTTSGSGSPELTSRQTWITSHDIQDSHGSRHTT